MHRSTTRRARALGTVAVVGALLAAAPAPAQATGRHGWTGPGAVERSAECPDLGRGDFTYELRSADGSVVRDAGWAEGPSYFNVWSGGDVQTALTRATVAFAEGVEVPRGCRYTFSLASYDTAGATWPTSGGAQGFLGHDKVRLTANRPVGELAVPTPGACGQVDLYTGRTRYDGRGGRNHGPLPSHDDGVIAPAKDELVAAWNGCAPA